MVPARLQNLMGRRTAPVLLMTLTALAVLAHPVFSRAADGGDEAALAALWQRGEQAFEAEDLETAFDAFREALDIDEGRARSWNYMGGVNFARQEWFKALLAFREALKLDPTDVRACNNVATSYERLGQFGRAEEYYLKAVAIDPDFPTSHRNLGILYARRLDRPAEARAAWVRYLELAPEGPSAAAVRAELEALPVQSSPAAKPPLPWPGEDGDR